MIRAFLVLALMLAMPAAAQIFRGFDANAPVQLENADQVVLQSRADRLVVEGNVRFSQGGLKLTADRVTIAYSHLPTTEAPSPDINRIDALGNVVFTKADETARGKMAIYDIDGRIITLVGDVSLIRGADRLSGERLVIDLESGSATMDGPPLAAAGGNGGRVSGTFNVRQGKAP